MVELIEVGFIPDVAGWKALYAGDKPGDIEVNALAGWLILKDSTDPHEERRVFAPADAWDGFVTECAHVSNFLRVIGPGEKVTDQDRQASTEYHKRAKQTAIDLRKERL